MFYHVQLGCRAYSGKSAPVHKDVVAYKEMSKSVITLRNSTTHYPNIEALEAMVDMAVAAIAEWPQLVTKYPAQVRIVQRYKTFKQLLPHSFPSSQWTSSTFRPKATLKSLLCFFFLF